MPKIQMEKYEEKPPFPNGSILVLKIEDCVVRPASNGSRTWENLDFTFKIVKIQSIADGTPMDRYDFWFTTNIYGGVSFTFNDSPDNRLKQWTEAIFNMQLDLGFELDTDLFIGRTVRGVTGQYQSKNGFTRCKITDLLPMGQEPTQVTPQAPPTFVAQPAAAVQSPQQPQQPQQQARVSDPWGSGGQWADPPF